MDLECADRIGVLIDAMTQYSDLERMILRARVLHVLDVAECGADRAETWDTGLFLAGFGGSLAVTVATAVNIAGYVSPHVANGIATGVLVLSSLATAALGLRERLKFREVSMVARQTASSLQRALFLFVSRSGPYLHQDAASAFATFMLDVEVIKSRADKARLHMRSEPSAVSAPAPAPVPVPAPATATAPVPLDVV